MTNFDMSNQPGDPTKTLGTIGVTGVVAFAVVFAAMHAVQPDLDPVERFGSDYANGKVGWLMQVGIVAAAVGALAVALGLRRSLEPGKRKPLGIWLLLIVAIGFAGSGLFRADPPRPDGTTGYTAEGAAHDLSGMVLFICLVSGTFVVAGVFDRDPRWRSWAATARIFGALILAGLVVTVAAAEIHPPGSGDGGFAGLSQRLFFAIALAWLALLGLSVRHLGSAPNAHPDAGSAPEQPVAAPTNEPPSVSNTGARPTRSAMTRSRAALGSLSVVVALAASGSLVNAVAVASTDRGQTRLTHSADRLERAATVPSRDATESDDRYADCMRSAGGTPDTLEHRVDACRASTLPVAEAHYLACMRDVGGTADTLERWAGRCVQVADAKARYEACLRDAGGTADAREHWVDTCRNRARP